MTRVVFALLALCGTAAGIKCPNGGGECLNDVDEATPALSLLQSKAAKVHNSEVGSQHVADLLADASGSSVNLTGVKHRSEDCGEACHRGGFCAWCGERAACCKLGDNSPGVCGTVTEQNFIDSAKQGEDIQNRHHVCVQGGGDAYKDSMSGYRCWDQCKKKETVIGRGDTYQAGWCNWCGEGYACCRSNCQGEGGCGPGCSSSTEVKNEEGQLDTSNHRCVKGRW